MSAVASVLFIGSGILIVGVVSAAALTHYPAAFDKAPPARRGFEAPAAEADRAA